MITRFIAYILDAKTVKIAAIVLSLSAKINDCRAEQKNEKNMRIVGVIIRNSAVR